MNSLAKIAVCIPPRPAKGDPLHDSPRLWGCLNPKIHSPLAEQLSAHPKIRQDLDFRNAIIRNGKAYIGNTCLNDLDAYFWYCEIDRQPNGFGLNVLKTISKDVKVFPDPWKWEIAVNKFKAHSLLQQSGINMPEFVLVNPNNLKAFEPVLEEWGAALLKPTLGAWGKGVTLIRESSLLRDLAGYFFSNSNGISLPSLYLEKYYKNDPEKWLSATVINGEIMYGYRKRNSKVYSLGDGKYKILDENEKGGDVDLAHLQAAHFEQAQKASEVLGCPIIGFDMIWVDGKPMIIDENTSPGNYYDLYLEQGKDPAAVFYKMVTELCGLN